MEITIGRTGNQKMKITDTSVSRQHCKVTPNGDGTFTLENLSANGTKVDGNEIIRTTASADSLITMGNFEARLRDILGIAAQQRQAAAPRQGAAGAQGAAPGAAPTEQPIYNIIHLKRIYEDYENTNMEMAKKQHKLNLMRTGLGLCTMCTMPLLWVIGPWAYILMGVGFLGNLYSFVGMKNSDSPEERKQRTEEFENSWVCPNPECNRSLPAKNYTMLKRNHKCCPYCKCNYVEKQV